jgi:hypothetical protein
MAKGEIAGYTVNDPIRLISASLTELSERLTETGGAGVLKTGAR